MTKDKDDRKCAFGVFLDIVDNFQEKNKKATTQGQTLGANETLCPFCSKEMESGITGTKTCRHCGKGKSDKIPSR